MKKEKKNFLLQHFVSPLLAASLALIGNYYLIQKPSLKKDYKALGVQILTSDSSTDEMKFYAKELINNTSPEQVSLSEAEKNAELEFLLNNIPYDHDFDLSKLTWGELAVVYAVHLNWIRQVRAICPQCTNKELFFSNYENQNKIYQDIKASKVETE